MDAAIRDIRVIRGHCFEVEWRGILKAWHMFGDNMRFNSPQR